MSKAEETVASPLSLDDLFKRASVKVAGDRQLKADREALGDRRTDPARRTAIEERVREWEFTNEWTTIGAVMRVTCWHCVCGSERKGPAQLLIKQEHRTIANTTRLVKPVGPPDATLPKSIVWDDVAALFCIDCIGKEYGS